MCEYSNFSLYEDQWCKLLEGSTTPTPAQRKAKIRHFLHVLYESAILFGPLDPYVRDGENALTI